MAISSNLCIPIAVGVPNLNPGQPNYFGPPNWLDQSQPIQHPFDNTLDDPRWLGAAEHSYGDGLGEDARFRALYYTQGSDTNLYLSWNVQLNFQGTGADLKQDSLFVGFNPITSSGGSGPASIIEIGINANPGAGSDLPPPNYSITVLISSGNTWSTTGTDQFGSWLTDSTRLWVGSTADAYSWAVQMVVPLGKQLTAVNKVQGSGTTLGKSFNMWYQLQTTAAKNIAMVNPYPWPSSVVFDGSNLNTFPNPMQPTQWGLVNVGNNQANQPCAAVGVSITYDTIGNDAVGATYPGNTTVSLNKPNTLFADPVNNDPNTTVNPGEVAARFRLAKWGSQNPSGTWPDVPGASQVFNTLHIPPAPGETGHIIHFPWTLDPNDIPSYQAEPDRCLLVELSSTKNITFVTDTAFKNLMFETTSSFGHKAEISVVGLQPIPGSGPNRDVYLFVETVNMPAFIEREPESPEQPTSPEQPVIEERPGALGQLDPLDLDFDVRRLELNRMVAEGRLNIGEAKRVLPTYIVHAFHDTGEKVTIKGVDHPRVESQTSFGYIAVHNGPLYGWRHDLQADTLTEIAPNLYKISVPNHGAATVTTVIEALEHPGKSGGFMLQSTFGKKGNFEVVVPHETAGLAHCVRDNDDAPSFPWRGPHVFGQSVGKVDAVALIQSNFDFPGHLEVVARTGNRLLHFWRDSGPDFIWYGPHLVATGVSGNPALIQGQFGKKGNFELVVPLASGGIAHYWRDNDDPRTFPWTRSTVFAQQLGRVDAVALIQSNIGHPGNLEVVARVGDDLMHFWRDFGPTFHWQGPVTFFTGATGIPGFIQSNFGSKGHFEVVTPLNTGGMMHLQRNNDFPITAQWDVVTSFGSGNVTAVSLMQSNFTVSHNPANPGPGDFEVAARIGDRTALYWRRDEAPFTWTGPQAYACS